MNEHINKVFQRAANDCMRCCVATLFGVDYGDAPDLSMLGWEDVLRAWARPLGYGFVSVKFPPGSLPPGDLIVAGPSPRIAGSSHAVIYRDGELWHDPHPEGGGIDSVDACDLFYRLRIGKEAT